MNKTNLILFLFIFLFCSAIYGKPLEKKTITRKTDPIIITGNKLKPLIGTSIEKIRLYAESGGVLKPIPHQIDERKPDGDFVFPFGPKPSYDVDRGIFDDNDELIFMAKDVGGRAAEYDFPDGFRKKAEIMVTDPLTQGRGWAYIFSFSAPPPPSKVDYVTMQKNGQRIKALNYETSFSKNAIIGFDSLVITKAGGGSGKNTTDRLKIRATMKTRVLPLTITKTEDDFTSSLIAYIDGPVRVIRRTKNQMYLFWKIPTPASVIDNIYYYDFFLWPTIVNVPF
ncbi:MAG: hypothetical protein AB1546_14055, partial [bacterium]